VKFKKGDLIQWWWEGKSLSHSERDSFHKTWPDTTRGEVTTVVKVCNKENHLVELRALGGTELGDHENFVLFHED